jgi:hypothetical protein
MRSRGSSHVHWFHPLLAVLGALGLCLPLMASPVAAGAVSSEYSAWLRANPRRSRPDDGGETGTGSR